MAGVASIVTAQGSAFTVNSAVFAIILGGTLRDSAGPLHSGGIDGADAVAGGQLTPGGRISFIPTTDTAVLIATNGEDPSIALRVAKRDALTAFVVKWFGEVTKTFTGCKVNSLSLSCRLNDFLKGDLDFQALAVTEAALGVGEPPSLTYGEVWRWYQGVVTLEGVGYVHQSWSISIENGLESVFSLDAPITNAVRYPQRLLEGIQQIRLQIETLNHIPFSVRGNNADEVPWNLTFSATLTAGGNILAISLDNLTPADGEDQIQERGAQRYRYGFETKHFDMSALTIAFTPDA